MTMGKRTGELETRAGDHQGLSGQGGAQCRKGRSGQCRDVAQRLVVDLAPLAEAAAQEMRNRLPLLTVLGLILAHHLGDVDRALLPCHTATLPRLFVSAWYYLGYTFCPPESHPGC